MEWHQNSELLFEVKDLNYLLNYPYCLYLSFLRNSTKLPNLHFNFINYLNFPFTILTLMSYHFSFFLEIFFYSTLFAIFMSFLILLQNFTVNCPNCLNFNFIMILNLILILTLTIILTNLWITKTFILMKFLIVVKTIHHFQNAMA